MTRVVIGGPLGPRDLAALCARVGALAEQPGCERVVCDVGALVRPDVGAVNALARLQLAARRRGGEIRLRDPSPRLLELIALCGLAEVLRVEPGRQPEEREQPLRVQERVEMGDPPVL